MRRRLSLFPATHTGEQEKTWCTRTEDFFRYYAQELQATGRAAEAAGSSCQALSWDSADEEGSSLPDLFIFLSAASGS